MPRGSPGHEGRREALSKPAWPRGDCTTWGGRTRTRVLGAEARRALSVAAAAFAVLAPVVAGYAGAASLGCPVAGLHRHQGLACGRDGQGGEAARGSTGTHIFHRPNASPEAPRSRAGLLQTTTPPGHSQIPSRLPVLALKHPSGFSSLSIKQSCVFFSESIFVLAGRLRTGGGGGV